MRWWILAIFILWLLPGVHAATNISGCEELNITNEIYLLNSTITGTPNCLNITAVNVTLDCQNNAIENISSGDTIRVNSTDVTIEHCILTNTTEIDIIASSDRIIIRHNIINTTAAGMLVRSGNATILNNTLTGSGSNTGVVFFSGASNALITQNTIKLFSIGINSIGSSSDKHVIFQNTVTDSGTCIDAREPGDNVTGNSVTNCSTGILVGDDVTVHNNTIVNVSTGIDSVEESGVNITNNIITNYSTTGILATDGPVIQLISNNTLSTVANAIGINFIFEDSIVSYNTIQGGSIALNGDSSIDGTNITYNVISDVGTGILIGSFSGSANPNNISDNLITNVTTGISLSSSVSNSLLINNNITNSSEYLIRDDSGSTSNHLEYGNEHGRISWLNVSFRQNLTINGTLGLGTSIIINNNFIELNVSQVTIGEINSSANITFYGIGNLGFNQPGILRNGQVCDSTTNPSCVSITSLTASTVIFNVSGWSSYSIGELSPSQTTSQTSSSGGGSSNPILDAGSSWSTSFFSSDQPLTEITFTVKEKTLYPKIKVTPIDTPEQKKRLPSELPNVYKYIEIEEERNTKLESVTIEFRVDKEWLMHYSIAPEEIVLARYTNKWEVLPTDYSGEKKDHFYYKSTAEGFSFFAITTKQKETQVEPEKQEQIMEEEHQPVEEKDVESVKVSKDEDTKDSSWVIWILSVVLVLAVLTYVLSRNRG